jgi:hypothetical protein
VPPMREETKGGVLSKDGKKGVEDSMIVREKKEGSRIRTREKGLCERARVLREEKEGNDGNETKIW